MEKQRVTRTYGKLPWWRRVARWKYWPIIVLTTMPFLVGAVFQAAGERVDWRGVAGVALYGVGVVVFAVFWALPVMERQEEEG